MWDIHKSLYQSYHKKKFNKKKNWGSPSVLLPHWEVVGTAAERCLGETEDVDKEAASGRSEDSRVTSWVGHGSETRGYLFIKRRSTSQPKQGGVNSGTRLLIKPENRELNLI